MIKKRIKSKQFEAQFMQASNFYQFIFQLIFQQIYQSSQYSQQISIASISQIFQFMLTVSSSMQAQHSQSQQVTQFTQDTQLNSSIVSSIAMIDDDHERHTRFLSNMIELDKTFRIFFIITKSDDMIVMLEKKYIQANQEFDMNVIFAELVRVLDLVLHFFEKISFKSLFMRTANHRETVLHHWMWLRITIESIRRDIRCFVTSKIFSITISKQMKYLNLILNLLWLYFVNAFISIRQSRIMIDDVFAKKMSRAVIDSELVFCKNHNLLIYLKFVMTMLDKHVTVEKIDDIDSKSASSNSFEDSNDDIFDVENSKSIFR